MEDRELSEVLEALLFASGEPVSLDRLADATEEAEERVARVLEEMQARPRGGLLVAEVAGGWMLCTRPEYAPFITRLLRVQPQRLSRAALETLAIVAYRQPITGPEIEAIRGVSIDGVLGTLLARGLICEAGANRLRSPDPLQDNGGVLRYLGIRIWPSCHPGRIDGKRQVVRPKTS